MAGVSRFRASATEIPHEYFYEMIEGVASDLEPRTIRTFDELYRYCYRVASVVGLTTIHIFGFTSPDGAAAGRKMRHRVSADEHSARCAGGCRVWAASIFRPRIWSASACRVDDLEQARRTEAFGELMEFEIARARRYYRESAPLLELVQPKARASLWALIAIYSGLLERIAESHYDVLMRRISLSTAEKTWIVVRASLGWMA